MAPFDTKRISKAPDAIAPDGSNVRTLLSTRQGSMAHFELGHGEVSTAVAHKTVEEIWYFLSGSGEMWRRLGDQEEVVHVEGGVCVTIPVGTKFQFRCTGEKPLAALGVTMPAWPGEGEGRVVKGRWEPTVGEAIEEC